MRSVSAGNHSDAVSSAHGCPVTTANVALLGVLSLIQLIAVRWSTESG
jgi:hypothetical protein